MAKIIELKKEKDKEYIGKCPKCGCKFSFLGSEYKMHHFWHISETVKCPNCKRFLYKVDSLSPVQPPPGGSRIKIRKNR